MCHTKKNVHGSGGMKRSTGVRMTAVEEIAARNRGVQSKDDWNSARFARAN